MHLLDTELKKYEKNGTLHYLFIDSKKAYD
jgi:hypothetical protein